MNMLFTILFLTSAVFGQPIEPGCRYAATSAHFYPVGVCESDRITIDGTVYETSFQYICDDNDVVIKEYFDGLGCMGEPKMTVDNVTETGGEIYAYSCTATRDCSYAMVCAFYGCGNVNDTACSQCAAATHEELVMSMHDFDCIPYVAGVCYGDAGFVHEVTCGNNLASETYYADLNCTNFELWTDNYGGASAAEYCTDENMDGIYSYTAVSCNVASTTAYPMSTMMDPMSSMMDTDMMEDDTTSTTMDSHDHTHSAEDIDVGDDSNQFVSIYSLFISSVLFFYV